MDWWFDHRHHKDKCDICPDLMPFKRGKFHDVNLDPMFDHDFNGLCCRRKKKKIFKCKLIPIGRVEVDCTPVTFETQGQADTVLVGPGCVTFTQIIP